MAWFDKQTRSRKRADLERKALAASVEELTARGGLIDEIWDEEAERVPPTGRTAIVPPRLSLQSRVLPAMHVDETRRESETQAHAQLENASSAMLQAALPGKRLGRSTRVRLQAVRPNQTREPVTEHVTRVETAPAGEREQSTGETMVARVEQPEVVRIEPPEGEPVISPALNSLGGSGTIKQGQGEVTVPNPQISEQSVVTIMLTGDPGPVVVQYVLLHPRVGFTFHLSAPAAASTSFNYAIWPC